MEYEELFILNEFSEIIKNHNSALEKLKRFREAYPYLIAPNIFDMLQHNLKENTQILFREMNGMKDQKNKQYSKRHTCRVCHKVYMMSLPGVFSCGDMHRGQSLVVWAIWEGRECACGVDEFLMGRTDLPHSPPA